MTMGSCRCSSVVVVIALLLLSQLPNGTHRCCVDSASHPPCAATEECERRFGEGSACLLEEGGGAYCTNPLESGCLKHGLPGWKKSRVCNSDDPPHAAERGVCRVPDFDYMEVRIGCQNWESSFFETWLLQILLSELLDVPTTVETGTADAKMNLYDPQARHFEYGTANDWDAFERAAQLNGDCKLANGGTIGNANDASANANANDNDNDNADNEDQDQSTGSYQSCSHLVPETWSGNLDWIQDMVRRDIVEPPRGLGALGYEGWMLPKFTALRDPSLATYFGLQGGEENRKKLATAFKRPVRWKEYCETLSADACASPTHIAQRAPRDESEGKLFYAESLYAGHFRSTEKNDCDDDDTNNNTCTGHIMDYPCDWNSFTEVFTFHLNIALESDGGEPGSNGYPYSEMVQILHAANATKSDIIAQWWTPEALHESFVGTDMELQRVSMPPVTPECLRHRISPEEQCSENLTERVGDPLGACEKPIIPLQKLVSTKLFERTLGDPSIPAGARSPAYDAFKQFAISNIQLQDIFRYWNERPSSPRRALCQWAVDNFDYLSKFRPRSYPRVLKTSSSSSSVGPFVYVCTVLGGLAAALVAAAAIVVFRRRNETVIRAAQIEFLALLMLGLGQLSLGATILGVPPSDGTCLSAMWLVHFGYTLELVPLIVKVAAINRLMHAARQMKRVTVRRTSLFGAVGAMNGLIVVFLLVWSFLDPMRKKTEYTVTDARTEEGDTVVAVYHYCGSNSQLWEFAAVAVISVLLLCATVLAFQTRKTRQEFNESQTLAILIYSHFMFLIMRLVTYFLAGSLSNAILQYWRSIIFSLDTIATICIYFVPKFFLAAERRLATSERFTTLSGSVSVRQSGMSHASTEEFYVPDPATNRKSGTSTNPPPPATVAAAAEAAAASQGESGTENKAISRRCRHCGKDT